MALAISFLRGASSALAGKKGRYGVLDRTRDRARWRRYRARREAGLAIAPVIYDAAVLQLLIETCWLAEDDAGDRGKVGIAIGRLLAASAKART
jgi:hypothetical protein